MARRGLAYGVVGAGLVTTLTAMAALHPHEHVYFNALVDTETPDALAIRYDMDYLRLAHRQSLEYLLARYPDDELRVWPKYQGRLIVMLPQEDRDRIISSDSRHAADFHLADLFLMREYLLDLPLTKNTREKKIYVHPRIDALRVPEQRLIHTVRAYGSAIAGVFAKDAAAYRAAYHDAYADIAANGDLLASAAFDIYALRRRALLHQRGLPAARAKPRRLADIPAHRPSRSRRSARRQPRVWL